MSENFVAAVGRRRQILDVALVLFEREGFHRVGVGEIGARIGISGPAIYRHFANKDAILGTLFEESLGEIISLHPQQRDDPRDELEALVRGHVEYVLARPQMIALYIREERSLVSPWREQFRAQMRHHADRWEQTLQRCYPDVDAATIAAAAQATIGMVHSVVTWPRRARQAPDLVDTLCTLVLDVLDRLGASSSPVPAP